MIPALVRVGDEPASFAHREKDPGTFLAPVGCVRDRAVRGVADVKPKVSAFRPAGRLVVEDLQSCVVGVHHVRAQHQLADQLGDRLECKRTSGDPVGQRRNRDLESEPLDHPRHPMQRLVIDVFATDDTREQRRARATLMGVSSSSPRAATA